MKINKILSLLVAISMLFSVGITAMANETAVAYIGEQGYETVQSAINAAKNGDIVTISAGEYSAIDISNKNITIQGTVGADGELLTTIKGGNPAITGHGFNGTIKDIKIVDAWKVMYAEPAGNVYVDNVYVTGATYGFHLIAYSAGLTWKLENSYMDLAWANSFGKYYDGDATIIIKGNEFASTSPYYPEYGAIHVNSFLPSVTVENNIFGENAKIYIDKSVADTSKVKISENYHADGVENAFAEDADGVKVEIDSYYKAVDENGNLTGLVRNPATLPNATVSKLNPITLTAAEHNYMVWPGGDSSIDRPLEIVMNFKTNETTEEARPNGFLPWKVDFNLKFTGLKDGKITADNCYLAGNYGSFGWIVIPTDGLELEEGVSYPVVAAYDTNITYKQICDSVKNFTAAIHVDQAILDANPDFKVELSLVMTNPEDENEKLVIGEPAVYTAADLKNEKETTLDTKASYVRNIKTTNAAGEERYQVMLFAGIDSLKYDSVGFEITVNGETRTQTTKKVFTSYTAAGVKYTPEAWGKNCKYIISLPVNFRTEMKDSSVTFRPFAVTLKGETLWGPEKTIDKVYNK